MSSNPGNAKLLVTGVSGFIASWLVKLLLLHGYTVNGAVRDLNDSRKVDHLLKLDNEKERLHLFEAISWKKVPLTLPLSGVRESFILHLPLSPMSKTHRLNLLIQQSNELLTSLNHVQNHHP
ncbi:hypothetical protein QN277_016522 [Acacia crassicarpa]|uniref:NAD(P)-binding domain-containing protein n=1 Tax=Acacia crassicarpa TaxID=499986 RepID=A0AAE1MWZ0_9FABA|nr:hypothetical protein QN277_016522 [Acacia crassicarpa]